MWLLSISPRFLWLKLFIIFFNRRYTLLLLLLFLLIVELLIILLLLFMRKFLWWLFFIDFINLWKENFYWLNFRWYFMLCWTLLTLLLINLCVNNSFHNSNRWSFMNSFFLLRIRNTFIPPVIIWYIDFSLLFKLLIYNHSIPFICKKIINRKYYINILHITTMKSYIIFS